MNTPSKVDRVIIRVLATVQLLLSLAGFPLFLFALNYGGAAANPGVLPLILLYLFYGVVTAIFLYSTLTLARVLALVWHAVYVGRVIVALASAHGPIDASDGFVLTFIISTLTLLYLAATSLSQSWQPIALAVRHWSAAAKVSALALLILVPLTLARLYSYTDSIAYQESLLHSSNRDTRCAAAKELAKKGSAAASALPALKSMMDHSDCIGEFGSFEIAQIGGIDPLIDLMRNGAPEARERVAWFLSNSVDAYPDRAAQLKQAFAAGLQDQDASVRRASTAGLGNLGPNAAEFLPQLMNLLNDPTPEIRLAAVDAIGKMNYVDGLRQALSNPDSQVRAAASGILRAIAPREK